MLAAGDDYGGGGAAAARAHQRRVRLRQPDRPADRGQRPPRRLRRRAARGCSSFAGHEVEREYYFNDAGGADRAARRSRSRPARAARTSPEDGYQGDYVAELADADPGRRRARRPTSSRARACALMIERIQATLRRLPRRLRRLVLRALAARGRPEPIERAFAAAVERRATSTAPRARCGCARPTFGDDKDRVLERSTGEPTYFAADVAYAENKLERGFDRLIIVAGRRPPRLRRADEGRDGRARRATRTGSRSRSCSSCTSSRAASARRCPSAAASSSRSTT